MTSQINSEKLALDIAKILDTKIKVDRNSKGKGTLTISFKNDEDFERLISLINKN